MRRLSILIFALVLVLAACGDDSSTSETTTAPTATVAADEHMDDADAHEEGDEHAEDERMDDADAHEEGDEHAEDEHMDDADAHEEGDEHAEDEHMEMAEGMSEEYIPEATGDVEASYTIDMHDFGYDVAGLELAPGMTVEFVLVNEGLLVHEFRLTTGERAAEHIAAGHVDHGEEGDAAHDEDRDIIVNVGSGETRTVVMTLPDEGEGFDQIACLIPGHYEAGMVLDI